MFVDFCSFGQVFSRALGVGHVEIIMGTTLHSSFGENRLWNEAWASWVW
jgi:hypothetical protein